MKTTIKLLGGLCLFISLGSCEVDEIEPTNAGVLNSADVKAVENFNNGMIKTYSSETVLKWNVLLSESVDNTMPLPTEAKVYAMVTLAVHDALNNVVPKYETYALDNSAVDASDISHKNIESIADAAVSQAARDMIVHLQLSPAATMAADELLNATLAGIEDSELKSRGIKTGKGAAAAVLAKRANDFALRFEAYAGGGTAPGDYQANYMPFMVANPPVWPANAVFAPKMGELTPFGIESGDHQR